MDSITALIATIPSRQLSLCEVIKSLAPQVDYIYLSFNGFSKCPDWLRQFTNVQYIIHPIDECRANVVWEWANFLNGYVFIADDDISYPPDYVHRMREALDKHERQAIMTVHGKWFIAKQKLGLTHFAYSLSKESLMDIAGVGTCCFHTSVINPTLNEFDFPYFRDLQFALLCKQRHIPIYAIQRKEKWLRQLPITGATLCDLTSNNSVLKSIGNDLIEKIKHEH
jgi:hypothetical protein